MDPTATLYTFHFLTDPSIRSVKLLGSWDNFTNEHNMERDSRRHCGQWRACHSFKESGGLKMGETYFYYYEVDGTSETHDSSLPSTTACPYLPGQPVNTLTIPIQQSPRKRSASVNSVRRGDYMTLNPADKFIAPRAAPPVPMAIPFSRVGTSAASVPNPDQRSRSSSKRPVSPTPAWPWSPRKLFSRSNSKSSLRKENDTDETEAETISTPIPSVIDDERTVRSSSRGSSRSRDMSPESLRRFLSDDVPAEATPDTNTERLELAIPDDIVEENEDDDNFATSARSESIPYFTVLSPPPSQRTFASQSRPETPSLSPPSLSPEIFSPHSAASNDIPSFYHSDDEGESEDDDFTFRPLQTVVEINADSDSFGQSLMSAFAGYSLPEEARASKVAGRVHIKDQTRVFEML
ncbi:hypothetical protein MCOR27_001955 [Pyricularia oryzae]|nr:hypothetical protein MCOR01_004057 [Pyricularia oryzae]KAI6300644.1 hypothetical protein MCOR33_003674 [Pyricularia grisea]KAH9430698.1 hypothetical protein MCOR02_008032 [Pyricularia oryzae]KAI6263632.1 hypothetical protein MCOR19_000267 [Pyricularia oryzae]KAI6272037.1 hypothetical protein MCOR26_007526 [Pyricularia oryzae]